MLVQTWEHWSVPSEHSSMSEDKGKKLLSKVHLSKGLHRSHCECSFISCYERKRLAGSHSPAAV